MFVLKNVCVEKLGSSSKSELSGGARTHFDSMLRSDRRCQTESERFSYLLRLFRDIKSNFLIKGQGAAHSEGSRGFVFARDNRDQVPGNLKT